MLVIVITVLSIVLVGYIINVLTTSSGSEYEGNSIDDFISHKDFAEVNLASSKKYRYYDRFGEPPGHQLRIIFGTEYGAAEDIAKLLYRRILSAENLISTQFHPRVINCKGYEQLNWEKEQLVLFIISTSGDGVPPTDAMPFMEYIRRLTHDLNQLQYSVLALGDSNYPHFCRTGIQLDDRLFRHNAKRIVNRHNVDMEDSNTIDDWINKVLAAILDLKIEKSEDYLPRSLHAQQSDTFHRNKPFYATIVHKENLTLSTSEDDRETVHIEFDLNGSSITWQSGDALGIYPHNSDLEVKDLLTKAHLTGREMVSIDNERSTEDTMPIIKALTEYLNLKDVSSTFIKHIRHITSIELNSFSGEVRDIFSQYNTLRLSAQELVNLLKPLQPRYYSISSCAQVKPTIACVTVVAVRYKLLGIERTGVCSIHLFDRCSVDNRLGVFISHNPDFRLPSDNDVDILMVGPGTGIAPFMSFISERVFLQATGKMTLYFGCRNRNKDFLYKEKLQKWNEEGTIKLYCVFSRENAQKKVYVQHLMIQQSKDIYQLMQRGGHIYICGDATYMAHDVHRALLEICMKESTFSQEQASQYLNDMAAHNRYQKDVWVTT